MLTYSAHPRRDDSAPMLRLPGRRGYAIGEKFLLEHSRRAHLVAGRIGRVDLYVPGQQVGGFLRDLVPIDRLRRRRLRHAPGPSRQNVRRRRRRSGKGGAENR
jgi:hypothetical protein